MMGDMTQIWSSMAGVMSIWAIFRQLFPDEFHDRVLKRFHKLVSYMYPYIQITFHEYQGDNGFEQNKAYVAIERYLSTNSSNRAKRLKANVVKDFESVVLSMGDHEVVTNEFKGIKIWWSSNKEYSLQRPLFSYREDDDKRYYTLTCKREHCNIINKVYLQHVIDEGKAIAIKTRQRKLYTNNKSDDWYSYKRTVWSHIIFEHPSTYL